MLLGTPDGIVDLATGQLRRATREDLIAKRTAVAPLPPHNDPDRTMIVRGGASSSSEQRRTTSAYKIFCSAFVAIR